MIFDSKLPFKPDNVLIGMITSIAWHLRQVMEINIQTSQLAIYDANYTDDTIEPMGQWSDCQGIKSHKTNMLPKWVCLIMTKVLTTYLATTLLQWNNMILIAKTKERVY